MADDSGRPFVVTLIGILYGLIAVAWLAVGIVALIVGDSIIDDMVSDDPDLDFLSGTSLVLGIVSIIVGAVYALICAGFLRGWSIMWYLGVLFSVLGVIGGVLSLLVAQFYMVIEIAVCLVVLVYLFKPNVREFFLGEPRRRMETIFTAAVFEAPCRIQSVRSRPSSWASSC